MPRHTHPPRTARAQPHTERVQRLIAQDRIKDARHVHEIHVRRMLRRAQRGHRICLADLVSAMAEIERAS